MNDEGVTLEGVNVDGTGVTIGFFDSGVGGLAYVPAVRSLLPRARLRYLADNECFPYGTRSDEAVSEIVLERIARLINACAPEIIVVACNTASVVALQELRHTFPDVVFVGVVPAVKPAAAVSRTGRIGVLATNRTVSAAYLDSLVAEFAQGLVVERLAGGGIVNFVETDLPYADSRARQEVVREVAGRFIHAAVDTVVLGCTHFLHLEDEFASALGPEVRVVDSRSGVARRVRVLVEERQLPEPDSETGTSDSRSVPLPGEGQGVRSQVDPGDDGVNCNDAPQDLFFTTAPSDRYSWFTARFGFEYAGAIGASGVITERVSKRTQEHSE